MPARHVVVDGSNIATEGRSLPSLVQLDEAVREYRREFVDDVITVVVDATFGHRIDPSERPAFDEAVAHNEIVSPPAGAIGRGDAFLLRVAEKVGATVLSNDSFQEFHGEHDWLFNNGRLIGGKPVPGVGWIFTPRTPVRGPKSRDSMREARRTGRAAGRTDEVKKVEKAIAVATEEAVEPDSPKVKRRRRSRSGSAPPAEPVNEPLPFIEFVAAHPLGSAVEGEVESFSSHGAFVIADQVRCYIPLSGMGDPPPRAAKEALKRGETRLFALQALDPPRRGIELALPEFAHVSGAPTAETVEEEIKEGASRSRSGRRRRGGAADKADEVALQAGSGDVAVVPTDVVVAVGAGGAEPTAAAPGLFATDATDAGPRKRPARPRAGAARTRPGAAPAPLAPDAGAAPAVPTVPAPTPKRAPSRKSSGQAAVDVGGLGDVVAPAPAEVSEAPAPAPAARKRRAAKASPAAAADTPPHDAEPAAAPRKRRPAKVAAPSSGGPDGEAAVAGATGARKAVGKRAASAKKAGTVAPAAAEAPTAPVKKAAASRKAASPRKAAAKRKAATPASAEVQAPAEPPSTDVGPVRKTTRKRAGAKPL